MTTKVSPLCAQDAARLQESLGDARLRAYIEPRQQRIDAALQDYLASHDGRSQRLHEAMRYVVHSGGKRLRPLLCVAAAELCGSDIELVIPTACATELVHSFSLVHDDLPAIDNDDTRRGQRSCHVAFGEAIAILTGDALFARAFELIALQSRLSDPERVLRVLSIIAHAASTDGMVGGEVEDLCAEGTKGDLATLDYIHTRKSGALIRASVMSGAILAGADTHVIEALETYGSHIGHGFQIIDDILGETGEPASMGKPIHSDRQRGKLTYPRLLGLRPSHAAAEQKIAQAVDALSGFGREADPLRWIALYVIERDR